MGFRWERASRMDVESGQISRMGKKMGPIFFGISCNVAKFIKNFPISVRDPLRYCQKSSTCIPLSISRKHNSVFYLSKTPEFKAPAL